jgi:hypothetical protein
MAWKYIFQIAFGSALVLAQTLKHSDSTPAPAVPPTSARVGVDEILSYECARSLATIVSPSEQTGPLFADGKLIFTSLEAQDSSKILLVNAGYGNFVINLVGDGVNRIRFELPTSASGDVRTFFLSYMHGGALRSRYFEYSEARPPFGRDELDYSLVSARRADNLMPHLDYAIHETAEATLSAITEGHVTRNQMARHRVENCEYISRKSPGLAKNLRHNVDLLDLIVMGPRPKASDIAAVVEKPSSASSRAPASVVKAIATDTSASLWK